LGNINKRFFFMRWNNILLHIIKASREAAKFIMLEKSFCVTDEFP